MVPLETVRGVYEKLSREAVEAQLTRPSPGRRIQQDDSNVGVDDSGYHRDTGELETASGDVMPMPDDDVSDGKKSMIQRTAALMQNGRAMSAPTTPVHRPLPGTDRDVIALPGTDGDVTDDELPQHGLTQALVAQWRELEERARADLMTARTGTSRSRSLSGLALRRGESPSPSRRDEQSRSDDGTEMSENDVDEQGRSDVVRQQQKTIDVRQKRDTEDGDEENELPPPLMTQYMLAKFRDMEAETQIIAGLQAKDRKVTTY